MQTFADIPEHIRSAMTPQMRQVVEHQLDRLARLEAESAADPARATAPAPTDTTAMIAAARAEYRAERAFWNEGGPQMHETRELSIRAAGTDVPVRIHRPSKEQTLPAIVYFHGGGFMLGDLDTHDRIARVIAAESGAAVVAVDYTLSPEVKFPQALLESAGVVAQLALHGDELGIDGSRLAVAGDSAGAMLSIGSTLLLRDNPGIVPEAGADPARCFAAIRAMLLYYGGYGLENPPAADRYGGFWDGMGQDDLGLIYETYLTRPEDRESPLARPLLANLDAPLPAAYVVGAALDPLRDDSEALGQRLEAAGHDVEWRTVPGVLHSFLHFGRMLDETNAELAAGARFARDRLAV